LNIKKKYSNPNVKKQKLQSLEFRRVLPRGELGGFDPLKVLKKLLFI